MKHKETVVHKRFWQKKIFSGWKKIDGQQKEEGSKEEDRQEGVDVKRNAKNE